LEEARAAARKDWIVAMTISKTFEYRSFREARIWMATRSIPNGNEMRASMKLP
jgi:hypothetical protein